jgi:hypothetical protein
MHADEDRDLSRPDGHFVIGSPIKMDPGAPHVGPTHIGGIEIGGEIVGVNDEGTEMIDVRITRYEAEVLYRHWFERYRDVEEFCFIYEVSGSREWREQSYCQYRLGILEDYQSSAFLDGISKEVERRNAEAAIAHEDFLRSEEIRMESLPGEQSREVERREAEGVLHRHVYLYGRPFAEEQIGLLAPFTEGQFEVFYQMQVSESDVLAIASIEDEHARDEVVDQIALGIEPEDAIRGVMKGEAPR